VSLPARLLNVSTARTYTYWWEEMREREREREKERWKETVSADAIRTVIEALPRHHVIVINVLPQ
jgi:hypothetical protein